MIFLELYIGMMLRRMGRDFSLTGRRFFKASLYAPVLIGDSLRYGDVLGWGVFFAAEDEGRTEEPSERKRQKEREKGRVPKSPEIPAALVTIGSLLVMFFFGSWMLGGMQEIMVNPTTADLGGLDFAMADMTRVFVDEKRWGLGCAISGRSRAVGGPWVAVILALLWLAARRAR